MNGEDKTMLKLFSGADFMRLCLAAAASLLLATAASAYTLIMRDGRRVEIPDAFNVTATALTYEHAPGLSVTVFLSGVDIAATERANGEPAGGLRRRAAQSAPETQAAPVSTPARRTVTNDDLTAYRRARETYEATENRRRAAAGRPSLDEERQSLAKERLRQANEIEKINKENQEIENYWRNRAARLREEAAALDSQINSLSAYLNNSRAAGNYFAPSYGVIFTTGYGYQPKPRPRFTPDGAASFGNNGPGLRNPPALSVSAYPRPRRQFGYGYNQFIFFNNGNNYNSYETERLQTRRAELQAERAALQARWEALQEEARRAGVPAGWVR
jgi:hypothetical protein